MIECITINAEAIDLLPILNDLFMVSDYQLWYSGFINLEIVYDTNIDEYIANACVSNENCSKYYEVECSESELRQIEKEILQFIEYNVDRNKCQFIDYCRMVDGVIYEDYGEY